MRDFVVAAFTSEGYALDLARHRGNGPLDALRRSRSDVLYGDVRWAVAMRVPVPPAYAYAPPVVYTLRVDRRWTKGWVGTAPAWIARAKGFVRRAAGPGVITGHLESDGALLTMLRELTAGASP